jgi:hypothetical protein
MLSLERHTQEFAQASALQFFAPRQSVAFHYSRFIPKSGEKWGTRHMALPIRSTSYYFIVCRTLPDNPVN